MAEWNNKNVLAVWQTSDRGDAIGLVDLIYCETQKQTQEHRFHVCKQLPLGVLDWVFVLKQFHHKESNAAAEGIRNSRGRLPPHG